MLGCYSSTVVRQQKRRDRRNRSSIFGLLDRSSPQIADVLPLSMSTPQRSMILDGPTQHHEETCSRARQVCGRYGTASEASVDDHGTMASHGHTFDDCRPALLQNLGLTAACQADTLACPPVAAIYLSDDEAGICFATSNSSDRIQLLINRSWRKHLLTSCLTWPVICMSGSSSRPMPRSRTVPVGGTRTPQTSSGTVLS